MTAVYRARAPKSTPDPTVEHEYSSVMAPITGRAADIARKMQASIQKSDLNPEEGGAFAGPSGSDGLRARFACYVPLGFALPNAVGEIQTGSEGIWPHQYRTRQDESVSFERGGRFEG